MIEHIELNNRDYALFKDYLSFIKRKKKTKDAFNVDVKIDDNKKIYWTDPKIGRVEMPLDIFIKRLQGEIKIYIKRETMKEGVQ
ncbi:MAG: hypothetical protein ACPLVF_02035 [Thermovenabulum sp.]|uniref:hypothetical protein n=1 Tax=Thermovenabulum sp. TaxID=3100335 RepID=UPI003C7C8DAE